MIGLMNKSVLSIESQDEVSQECTHVKTHWSIECKFWINDLSSFRSNHHRTSVQISMYECQCPLGEPGGKNKKLFTKAWENVGVAGRQTCIYT